MPRLDVRSKEQIKSVLYLFSLFIITASTVKALVNPVPLIDSVSPVSAAPGASGLTLTVHGAGFLANSTVNWNVGATTTALVTTFVSSTQLQAAVPNSLVTSSLSASITVVNPSVGAASNVIYFPVLAAIPSVSFTGTNLPAGNGAYSLAVGDFNRDGLPDFAVANNLDSTVSLFLSQTGSPGTFSASTIGTAEGSFSGPTGIIAADFNNDGYIDFAVANGNSNSVSVLLNTPATPGTFTLAQSTTFAAGSFPAAIAAADFNGDGYTDLVVSNYNGHDVTVLFNSTGGTPANFSAAPGSPYSVPSNPNGIAVADFNNDGYPDFAVTVNTSPGQIAVFLNNNGGTVGSFASTTAITVGSDPVGLIAADFDQDGKIDLAVANYLSNSVWVLPGNGSGSFSASGPQLGVNGNPYGLATGDLNADGKLDIAVTDSLNGKVDVFLASAGTPGTFSATPLVFNADNGTQGLGIADFDSNGSLDIAAASYYGATATTLIQLPTATLLPSTINFGIQLLNTPSTAQTTVLTNTGSLPLTISSIAVSGANSSDFSLTSNPTNNCGGSVAAGASCTISVTFTPAGAGPRSATLNLVDNLPGSPQTVSLSGTGGVPTVGISPNILNFNTQPVDTTSAAQSVTLSNTGAVALTITSIAVIGDFAETNNCGSSVPTSGSCVISLTFTPAASGMRNGTLTVTDNSGGVSGTTQTASLSGTGIAPIASLAPSTLSFGNQLVGSTSTAQSLTLSNSGTTPLSITGVTITGANSADFVETNSCGTSLPAGSNCAIGVTFKPGAAGVRSATLTVTYTSTGVNSAAQTANLSGTGTAPVAALSGGSVSFGNQLVGASSAVQSLTLTNSGTAALTIAGIAVTGDFAQTNTCGSSLGAGANCTINITFTPTVTGTRSGTLTVTDNSNAVSASQQTASLTGNGAVPLAAVSTPSLTFGNQVVGSTSGAQTVMLSNSGSVALTITSISLGGANAGDFVETNNCGGSLAAGANCAISVSFKPTSAGARSGNLLITDNSNGSSGNTQIVSLAGTGIPALPAVALSATSLSFGYHMTGTNFGPKTITLTNTGNAALAISGISATSGFAQSNTCGTQLAAGANCTITVSFVPATPGVAAGALTIADNAAGSPHTVILGGTGTSTSLFLSQAPLSTLSFGPQAAGTTTTLSLVMANAVNTPLLIRRVIVAPRPVFQVAGTCGASIAPSETCTLLISFTPMVPMSYRGVLALLDNATPRPVQVYRLTGQGSGSRPAERTNTVEAVTDGLRCEDLSALEGEESLLLNLAQNCRP